MKKPSDFDCFELNNPQRISISINNLKKHYSRMSLWYVYFLYKIDSC